MLNMQGVYALFEKLKRFTESQIENSITIIIFMWWALFSFVITFFTFVGKGYTSNYSSLPCWPHFQDCKNIFPLIPLPFSYSENIFYAGLLSIVVYGAYNLYYKNFFNAYICILILWFWEFFVYNVTYGLGNFDYYNMVLIGVFLFFTKKIHYLRFTFVFLYFLAATIKIGSGWIDGTYFTSLQTGVPIFPNSWSFLVSNVVILMQIVGCWFLLMRKGYLFTFALWYFCIFHLYSTILVGYRYPVTSLFLIIILFGLREKTTVLSDLKPRLKDWFNWVLLILLVIIQFIGIIIPGNQKITMEGNKYGLYMFEANHQCISLNVSKKGTTTIASSDARSRCDPYVYLERLKKECRKIGEPISWSFDASVNGGPLYRVIEQKNACGLVYKPFAHNIWINVDNPKYIAEVHKNVYDLSGVSRSQEVFLKKFDGKLYMGSSFIKNNSPSSKTPTQEYIYQNLDTLIKLYWIVWLTTLILVSWYIIVDGYKKT